MEMLQLQPDQIAIFWDSIKQTMISSNVISVYVEEDYLNHTLEKCLSGKLSVWVYFDKDPGGQKQIYTMVITSIVEDRLFGYNYVIVEGIFGFRRLDDDQASLLVEKLGQYCKNVGAKYLKALTSNPKAMRICEAGGAKNIGVVYSLEV